MNKILTAALAVAAIGFGTHGASAASFTVEHNFCVKTNCVDGSQPGSAPVADSTGNYYGTTSAGGKNAKGTIYRMSLTGKIWKSIVLHSFCLKSGCADGSMPQGGLIIDTMGNLYGMASAGGRNDSGLVYELSPNGKRWDYSVLYAFCKKTNCPDGQHPYFASLSYQGQASGVAYDGTSPLYGTAQTGGANMTGVVFRLMPNKGSWTYTKLYDFCSQTNCADGAMPFSGVVVDGSGNLFGAATLGGLGEDESCCGVLFELKPHGAGWTYIALHSFCSVMAGSICTDGRGPIAAPMIDATGALYGTTGLGGASDFGSVYKLVPDGSKSKLVTLYNFCTQTNCADGGFPWAAPLAMDAAGKLYGTASQGGSADSGGTVFSLSGAKLNKYTTLNTFDGKNGAQPLAGLTLDPSGALVGVASTGGKGSQGVFFEVKP